MFEQPPKYKPLSPQTPIPTRYTTYLQQSVLFMMFKWKEEQMETLCGMLEEWRLLKFMLSMNQEPRVLGQVVTIGFPVLQVFTLTHCLIQSVQPLCQLDAPVLHYISFDDNLISCIKSLKKCYFPSLTTLSLSNNKLTESSALTHSYTPKLQYISLQTSQQIPQPDQQITWLAKFPNPNFKQLNVAYRKRLLNSRMSDGLRRRYGREAVWDWVLDLESYYQN